VARLTFITIAVPFNAGEPLQRVMIAQIEGLDNIPYNLKDSYAFEGTRSREDKKVKTGQVTIDRDKVKFDPLVPPGKTVTIALRPVRNPFSSGVYLFGVTAFPAGEKAYGLYLGVGRMHSYRRGGFFGFY